MPHKLSAQYVLFILILKEVITIQYDVFTVTVEPYEELCYIEDVWTNSQAHFTASVYEGGFLDITLKYIFPNGTSGTADKITTKNIEFTTTHGGQFHFCFDNSMSTLTPKTVEFAWLQIKQYFIEMINQTNILDTQNLTTDRMMNSLSDNVQSFHQLNRILYQQKIIHTEVNNQTNRWVWMWAIFEFLLLVALAFGQVYYITKFFEVKRPV